jgi:hypothetical protein
MGRKDREKKQAKILHQTANKTAKNQAATVKDAWEAKREEKGKRLIPYKGNLLFLGSKKGREGKEADSV